MSRDSIIGRVDYLLQQSLLDKSKVSILLFRTRLVDTVFQELIRNYKIKIGQIHDSAEKDHITLPAAKEGCMDDPCYPALYRHSTLELKPSNALARNYRKRLLKAINEVSCTNQCFALVEKPDNHKIIKEKGTIEQKKSTVFQMGCKVAYINNVSFPDHASMVMRRDWFKSFYSSERRTLQVYYMAKMFVSIKEGITVGPEMGLL